MERQPASQFVCLSIIRFDNAQTLDRVYIELGQVVMTFPDGLSGLSSRAASIGASAPFFYEVDLRRRHAGARFIVD
jgi:hypothetical protein